MNESITQVDLEEIARQIVAGNTSGNLDDEGDEELGIRPKRISWDLNVESFER